MLSVSTMRMRSRVTDRRVTATSPAVGGSANLSLPAPAVKRVGTTGVSQPTRGRMPLMAVPLRAMLTAATLLALAPATAWAAKATLAPRTVFLPIGGLQLPVAVSGELL